MPRKLPRRQRPPSPRRVVASAVGAPLLTIGGFRGRFSALGAEGRGHLIEILHRAGDFASLNKVRIVLEPINHFQSDGIASVAEGLNFLADLDHELRGAADRYLAT